MQHGTRAPQRWCRCLALIQRLVLLPWNAELEDGEGQPRHKVVARLLKNRQHERIPGNDGVGVGLGEMCLLGKVICVGGPDAVGLFAVLAESEQLAFFLSVASC